MKKIRFPFPTSRNDELRGGAGWDRIEKSLQEITAVINDSTNELEQAVNAANAAAAQAGEYAEEAFSGTPEGYEALVADVGNLKTATYQYETVFEMVANQYVDNQTGEFKPYNNWSRSDFIDVTQFSSIIISSPTRSPYCCWYSDNDVSNKIGAFTIEQGDTILPVRDGAKYIVISNTTTAMNNTHILNAPMSFIKALNFTNVLDVNLKYNDRSDLLAQLTGKDLILVFTDLHGNKQCLDRISKFYNNNRPEYVAGCVSLGDIVYDQATEDISAIMNDTFMKSVMKVIGNHDLLVTGELPGITTLEAYNKYLADDISSWGVVQPSGASASGLTYYYKDFGGNNPFRLIVLDEYFYDEAQHTWFVSVLNDAITNNKPVMIAQHQANVTTLDADPLNDDYAFATPQLGFDLYITTDGYKGDYASAAENRIMAVDKFVDDGGTFICWINGHTHSDQCHTFETTHATQLSLTFSNAGTTTSANLKIANYAEDLFQYIAVDTTNNLVYVLRIGETTDKWLHHNLMLCYDYANHTVINYK